MAKAGLTGKEEVKVFKTVCGICGFGCGINAYVKDGELLKVTGMPEHPMNRGFFCARAKAVRELVYHPDRLLYPQKKTRGQWKRIPWDEALDLIARRLKSLKETYGARSLAVCFGQPVLTQGTATIGFMRRFLDAYGSPSVFSVDSMCWRSRLMGTILTFGKYPMPDVENTKCLILWGHNPSDSYIARAWAVREAQKKGAKLIVVDPRRIPFAKKADLHIQLRPGTDGALLLAMMNIIIAEKLYDHDFVARWTVGFDKLAEAVKDYTPERVEKITSVPAASIREMTRIYATTKPACIHSPNNTIEESGNAVQNHRAISVLQAITGNFEVVGGDITTSRVHHNPIRLFEQMEEKPLGTDKYPLFYGFWGRLFGEGEGQSMLVPDAILSGKPYPIKAAIVSGSNPLLTWPHSTKVRKAFSKLDFLVVMDFFMTDTAKLADVVLPAATCFERNEVFDFYRVLYGIPYVMLKKKLIQVGECWSDTSFYLQLAKKMGYDKEFPWKNDDEVIDYLFAPMQLSIKRLTEEAPQGMWLGKIKIKEYEERGFPTPSGKVEIYSETLAKLGQNPLPSFTEPPESPVSTPELAKEYPLVLTTGARKYPYSHSEFRNIPSLRRMVPDPEAEIHPSTAARYGLKGGDMAIVETKRGKIEIKVKATPDILPGVVCMAHGWTEANANILTDNAPADPISGFPAMRALLCRIKKKE